MLLRAALLNCRLLDNLSPKTNYIVKVRTNTDDRVSHWSNKSKPMSTLKE